MSLFGQSNGPFTKDKLQATKELTDIQLELKHIEESCSLELSYFCYKKEI